MIKKSTEKKAVMNEAYGIFFTSLANTNRLKMINLLRKGRMNVAEICLKTGFEQTMVSHNLKRLERCGMVFPEKKGKFKYFSVNQKTIKPLLEMIDAHMKRYCCKLVRSCDKEK